VRRTTWFVRGFATRFWRRESSQFGAPMESRRGGGCRSACRGSAPYERFCHTADTSIGSYAPPSFAAHTLGTCVGATTQRVGEAIRRPPIQRSPRDEHVLRFGLCTHMSRLGCSGQSADRLPLPICGRNGKKYEFRTSRALLLLSCEHFFTCMQRLHGPAPQCLSGTSLRV
jgi:hypothetical protein